MLSTTMQNSSSSAEVVQELSIVSCSLSILGALVIIWTYVWLPEIRNPVRKLFTWLTLADFLTASGYLVSAIASISANLHAVCTYQSYVTTYSSLVSFNLTIAIAIQLFSTVVFSFDGATRSKFVFEANFFSWLIPAIIISIAGGIYQVLGEHFIHDDYSNNTAGTGPWCWKANLIMLYGCLSLYLQHRQRRFEDFHETIRDEDQNFLYVWFVFFVIRLWGTVRFFMKIFNCDKYESCQNMNDGVFLYMQAFGDPSQAFCNFILFVIFDKTVRHRIFNVVCHTKQLPNVNSVADERTPLIRGSS